VIVVFAVFGARLWIEEVVAGYEFEDLFNPPISFAFSGNRGRGREGKGKLP
jgi:hypothetical protein